MPSEAQSLRDFIDAMKSQGASDEIVVALLRQNGWSERRIYQNLGAWYEARTGAEIPNGGGRIEAAKDAFLYLLAFITLGIWAIQLGALFFTSIDLSFPNPAVNYANSTWTTRSMANELASVLVAFPLFLWVSRWIIRGYQQQPERLESAVRKWLTYLALVITASTMIGDVVTFLAYLLRGDLNTRFLFKVITVLAIAGGVFAYYLDALRRDQVSSSRNRTFVFAALGLVSFGLITGFVRLGSPSEQRFLSQDAGRLNGLSTLAGGLHHRWQFRGQMEFRLPPSIQEVPTAGMAANTSILDPVNGRTYEYAPLDGSAYRLCAMFSNASPADVPRQWSHPAGHACFTLDAKEEVAFVSKRY